MASSYPSSQIHGSKLFSLGDYDVCGLSLGANLHAIKSPADTDRPSGDWMGVIRTGEKKFRVALADLEGKGNDAGPYHDYLESSLVNSNGQSGFDWLTEVHSNWPGPRFATAVVLDVDVARHQSTLVTAAHPAPVFKPSTSGAKFLEGPGLGLVGIPDCFQHHVLSPTDFTPLAFAQGSSCVLFSDGVLDAGVNHGKRFGPDGLLQAVDEADANSNVVDEIARTVFKHVGDDSRVDDLSVVVVRRLAPTRSNNGRPTREPTKTPGRKKGTGSERNKRYSREKIRF